MHRQSLFVCFVSGAMVGSAAAGPDWTEVGDAGKLTPQFVGIPVQPQSISGSLGAVPLDGMTRGLDDADGGHDVADLFDILIETNEEFIATTFDPTFTVSLEMVGEDGTALPGPTTFDSALWIFRTDKRGLLGNNDISATNSQSRLLPIATDATGSRILTPGRYLIAVSFGDVAPVATGGAPIFNFSNSPGQTQVSGPDGQGGQNPLTGWTPDVTHPLRKYRISIRPTPCRPPCSGDANGDAEVNFQDITAVLASWQSLCQ